jgi:RNA chaperone Hfq
VPRNVEPHNVEPMPRKKFIAKGHDAQLQEAQIDRIPVELTTLSGVVVSGTVSRRDKYTISLRHGEGENVGRDEIFYKHAIESVLLVRATPRAN